MVVGAAYAVVGAAYAVAGAIAVVAIGTVPTEADISK